MHVCVCVGVCTNCGGGSSTESMLAFLVVHGHGVLHQVDAIHTRCGPLHLGPWHVLGVSNKGDPGPKKW